MKLYIGTSGYSDKEWKGSFYPNDLPASEMLSYYAQRFPAVEVNSSFRQIPKESDIKKWAGEAPDDFQFAFKAPQTITHFRRL